MEDIFRRAKTILIIWGSGVVTDDLPPFQEKIQTKAPSATLAFENVDMLLQSNRSNSYFDLILFGLISNKDIPITIDLINEFFRILRPEGRLITHIDNNTVRPIINSFKMCGFSSCQPLDSNSSFLIDNKDQEAKRLGTLWLCQKPTFDIGYAVPLKSSAETSTQKAASSVSKLTEKTWTMDDDDLIDTDQLLDDNDRKKPDVKNYDCGTASSGVRKACKNCTCGLAQELEQEEHTAAKQSMKSSCGSCYLGDAFRCAGCPMRGLPPFKPGDRVVVPNMSDV